MIGTTHFTNAVVERKRLRTDRGGAAGSAGDRRRCRRWSTGRTICARRSGRHTYLCHGGHEFDGREISPLDPDEIREVAEEIAGKRITAVAVSSVFSPVNTEHGAGSGRA